MAKILVTGGTGFIGSSLVARLVQNGHEVRVLARKNTPHLKRISHLQVEVATGDITLPESLAEAVKGVQRVFHCAAVVSDWAPKKDFYEINVTGTENILKACVKEGVERFVGLSTNDVFGVVEDRIIDETLPFKKWNEPYPDTKILAEELTWKYHREHGLPAATVYPCWVYGVNDTSFLPHIVESLVKNEIVLWRKNSLMWPTYIENLLDLLVLISEDPRAVGNGYLIHDGQSYSFEEFCQLLAGELQLKAPHTYIPYWATYTAGVVLEGLWKMLRIQTRPLLTTYVVKNLGSRLQFSLKKAEEELGWKPRVSFEEGFGITMQWLKTVHGST